ncbi:MAG TPA: amylo-alpha-1,6-glucosidase [Polyangiaceae bacterium]|nr:amylo-alpha-1,6-glucosidase [Polyangiaceae bacterium]
MKKPPAQERRNEWRASLQGPWPFVHTAGELDPSEREWLHTNGAGAFSTSTVALMHTRRHHGVLVAALDQPLGRHVIVSHAETTLNVEDDKRTYRLATHQFPSVAPTPGYRLIESFHQDPIPRWIFRLGGHVLERTLCLARGHNAVIVAYTWHGKTGARMSVRPLMPLRAADALMTEHGGMMQVLTLRSGSVELQPVVGLPTIYIAHEGVFMGSPDWWRRFEYLADRGEGREFQEDMWTPGTVEMQLEPGKPVHLMIGIGSRPSGTPAELVQQTCAALRAEDPGPERSPAARVLSIASEQFCLEHAQPPVIIAGYPWHTVFTRDLVMSITGLLLTRGKVELAKKVLGTVLSELRYGLLPETLVESPTSARPHPSPDATLWLFDVARELMSRVGVSDPFVQTRVYPALVRIFSRVRSPRRRWVWLSPDGLVTAIERGVALTWMDARVDGQPVTPRYGVPVELQGLWSRGCETLAELAAAYGHEQLAGTALDAAHRARTAFRSRFWCAETDYPYDCISEAKDAAEAWSDPSVRPNALLAVAADPDLLDEWQTEAVLETIDSDLLTPRGLRSLAPSGKRYVGHFTGGVQERELAYHQGTAWPHLLGAYVRVRLRLAPDDAQVTEELATLLERAADDGVLLGQVGQLADGEAPHRFRGCPAQATSVAELLRALTLLGR